MKGDVLKFKKGKALACPLEPRRRRGGFTIIEIIIVMAMSSLIIFVISSLGVNISTLQNLVGQKLQSRGDIDQALQIVTTEIRSAGPSSLGAYAIDSANTSSFAFYSDIYKNGIFERVRYFVGTSTVQKGVIVPTGNPLVYVTSTEVVTTAIVNMLFTSSTQLLTYYGPTYTGVEPPLAFPVDVTQVRVVKVNLYADINPGKAPQPLFFSNTVDLRNLRSN